jgi:hypothetical protein
MRFDNNLKIVRIMIDDFLIHVFNIHMNFFKQFILLLMRLWRLNFYE